MAENEVVFRQYNEQVMQSFEELKAIAKEHNQEDLIQQHDLPVYFYCECSDENCEQRIWLKPSDYNSIHQDRDKFTIACGHEISEIEKIVDTNKNYCVVEKNIDPPETADTLHTTQVNNV